MLALILSNMPASAPMPVFAFMLASTMLQCGAMHCNQLLYS